MEDSTMDDLMAENARLKATLNDVRQELETYKRLYTQLAAEVEADRRIPGGYPLL